MPRNAKAGTQEIFMISAQEGKSTEVVRAIASLFDSQAEWQQVEPGVEVYSGHIVAQDMLGREVQLPLRLQVGCVKKSPNALVLEDVHYGKVPRSFSVNEIRPNVIPVHKELKQSPDHVARVIVAAWVIGGSEWIQRMKQRENHRRRREQENRMRPSIRRKKQIEREHYTFS